MSPYYHTEGRKTIPAKKSLGQNFLTNKFRISDIISALGVQEGETIIEIGPGHGELTEEILKRRPARVVAVEKDGELAGALAEKFGGYGDRLEIISGDALKILPKIDAGSKNYKIIGNIPYYITGFLLRTIGEMENKPKIVVLTVQKEVAERIAAKPPKMNLLAANVQIWAEPEILGILPKTDFFPVPKVDSAIIRLKTLKAQPTKTELSDYERFVRALFKQPRKTIMNNLLSLGGNRAKMEEIAKKIGIDLHDRPQEMSISDIQSLRGKLSA